jgi:hypothetical protein
MAKELRRAPDSLSVWESNMKELQARQPNLAVLLHNYVKEHGHEFEHYENRTPAGKWIEGLTDEPFFERDEEPKFNWSRKKREDKNKPVFMLYGVGTPPYLFKAIKALPDAALSMIVVEPNLGLLAYTLHLTHVYLALPGDCRLVFLTEGEGKGETEEELRESQFVHSQILCGECLGFALQHIGIYSAALSELSGHAGELDVWRDKFTKLGEKIREWISVSLSYLGNSAEDTLLGLRQIALMAPRIAFGAPLALIHDKFKGKPAILVAAGPSLDKNFAQLKDVQDKCVIIAADAVLGKLLKNGIKPHIVTSLERVFLTYELFFSSVVDEYKEECRDILLVAQSLCVPWTSGRWPGPVCLVYKHEVIADAWLAGGLLGGSALNSGLSVAHMNYTIAGYVGASSVAIIGQDLAYGDDGHSHAGGIGGAFDRNSSEQIKIPGAMGGDVYTNRVWLSFLRLLENIINVQGTPTWDCTEGGALISGAKVLPLADFIEEHVLDSEPLEQRPSDIVSDGFKGVDHRGIKELVLADIKDQYRQFDMLNKDLDDVTALMDSAVAAGLEPARRVAIAVRAGKKLDLIHTKSPLFDFIGQSYTRLASIELSLTRSLEDVETTERWYVMHKEVVDSHRALVSFVRKWVSHAERSIAYWGSKDEIEFTPLGSEEAWEAAVKLFKKLDEAEGEEVAHVRLELDSVMMRCDPVLLKWSGRMLWGYAKLLMLEGRAALATRFMNAAAEDFDGKEMPVRDMAEFFKDYARVLMNHDLTHAPDYSKAELMLANATDLGGVDDEIKEILAELLDSQVAFKTIIDEMYGLRGDMATSGWFKDRARAQMELHEGDLKRALSTMWRAIATHWKAVPGWAASHLDWLVQTLEKCMGAGDPELADAVDGIISEIAASEGMLEQIRISYSQKFVDALHEKGNNMKFYIREERKADVPDDSSEEAEDVPGEAVAAESAEVEVLEE